MEKNEKAKRKTSKGKLNVVVRRSVRNADQSEKIETTENVVDVTGKRKRKPNLRYANDTSVRPESKEEDLRGNDVTATPKHDGTDTTAITDKPKKNRKRKNVKYEINCSDIKEFDIKAFQVYLRSEMKVAGKKNSPSLKVIVQGVKMVIKSKIYVPKKSLRYAARKYFKDKKMYSVCVSNESTNSYKLTSKML